MKKLFFLFFVSIFIGSQAQIKPTNQSYLSPNGIFESVFDNYGNQLQLNDVAIMPKQSVLSTTILHSSLLYTSGIFEIYYEEGSGMELPNDAIHVSRRNVINKVFLDVSDFLISPLKNVDNSTKIKIWIRDFDEISSLMSNQISYGTSYYNVPKKTTSTAGIIDSQLWKTVNGGKDAYDNLSNIYYDETNKLKFYHATFAFNFKLPNQWHLGLNTNTPSNKYDLYSYALREVVHALGYNSLISENGASKLGDEFKSYSRFDTFLNNQNNQKLINNTDGCSVMEGYSFVGSVADLDGNCNSNGNNSNNSNCGQAIRFVGAENIKLYTPNCYSSTSSFNFSNNNCNNLIATNWLTRANFGLGNTQRYLNNAERLMLNDLGYSTNGTFGDLTSLNYQNYGGTTSTNTIVGINDGFEGDGSYIFDGNINENILITNFLNNDFVTNTTNLQFECLKDITHPNTTLSATSGNVTTQITLTTSQSGLHVLSYIPYDNVTGKRGNITYVFVNLQKAVCPITVDSCNLVVNGGFEQNIGTPDDLSLFENLVCSWRENGQNATPDYFHTNALDQIVGIPLNFAGDELVNPIFGGNAYAGIHVSRLRRSNGTISRITEIISGRLATPLQASTTYILSFDVSKPEVQDNGVNAEIQALLTTTQAFLNTNTVDNVPAIANSILLDNNNMVTNTNGWTRLTFTFTTGATAGHNFVHIGGLRNPQFNVPSPGANARSYYYIDNVQITEVIPTPILTLPSPICATDPVLDLNSYLTNGVTGGFFSINGTPIIGSTFNLSTVGVGTHTINYTIPSPIACPAIVVSGIITVNSCLPPNPPYISQVFTDGKNRMVEIKNASNTTAINAGNYYLVLYDNGSITPTVSIDLASLGDIPANGVKVFKGVSTLAPGYIASTATLFSGLQFFTGVNDVLIISRSNGINAFADRIDIIGDNTGNNIFYKDYTLEDYKSLVRMSCTPMGFPRTDYDEQDWVGFNKVALNAFGVDDDSNEVYTATAKTNDVLGRHYSDELRWNGSWDDLGILNPTDESNPERSRIVLINQPYDTSVSGNFEACSLVSNVALNIASTNYVKVQTKVTSSPPANGIVVQDDGSLIQVRDKFYTEQNQQLITVNGINSFKHARKTNGVNHEYDYVYWSSPLSTNLSNQPINYFFPFGTSAGMFKPDRFFIFENVNFNDSNGDLYDDQAYTNPYNSSLIDYVPFSVLPNYTTQKFIPGRGYITWPAVGNTTDYTIEFKGEMNNGQVFVPIYNNNSSSGQNPNLVGNPYPSPIDLNILFNVNFDVIEPIALIWGRAVSNPEVIYPGPDAYNYSEDNYLIYNPTMIIDPNFTTNNSFNSEGVLASCQSFFVRAKGGINYVGAGNLLGDLKFSNIMRSTKPNTTFARTGTFKNEMINSSSSNEGKLWLNLTDNQGYSVQQGIAFLENKNNEFVPDEDIRVVSGRKYNFYSKISNQDVVINLQNVFDETKVIPLEITNISENVAQTFTISMPKKEGVFNEQTVYLYDALLNVVHNLSATSYAFTTSDIVTESRFYLQFTNTSSNLAKQTDEEVVVYSKEGVVYISSKHHNIAEVNVVDLYNVKNGIKSIASAKQKHTKSVQVEVTDLSKLIEVTITLENGTIVHKKISK